MKVLLLLIFVCADNSSYTWFIRRAFARYSTTVACDPNTTKQTSTSNIGVFIDDRISEHKAACAESWIDYEDLTIHNLRHRADNRVERVVVACGEGGSRSGYGERIELAVIITENDSQPRIIVTNIRRLLKILT